MTNMYSHDEIKDLIEEQLSVWDLAKTNYDALTQVKRRQIKIGDQTIGLQWNPARITSTGAKVDPETIKKRPCFLCRSNRPAEQKVFPILDGWELLINPYPIFPVHLTIVNTEHKPQSAVPQDIVEIALKLPGMTVFFNGARSGASAPDHMHLQAVLKEEIPLIQLVEKYHPSNEFGLKSSTEFGLNLPYLFFSGVVSPEDEGMKTLVAGLKIGGLSEDGSLSDPELVNTFFWLGEDNVLRFLVVPRRRHRPSCYDAEGENRRVISPGCIDMAGLLVIPREADYTGLSAEEIKQIYQEVGIPSDHVKVC